VSDDHPSDGEKGESDRASSRVRPLLKKYILDDHMFRLKITSHSQASPPRCPTVGTFRLLSHTYHPLSHALFLIFVP
jgi:hypothetical protein